MSAIPASEAKGRVHRPGEIAFLDVREAGEFGEGHPFLAVPCPYSRLDAMAPALVPRRAVPIVLIDGGDGVAARAERRLRSLGYGDVAFVDGGTEAWAEAGFTLFKGVNLPSKTLGELVEHEWYVPSLGVDELDRRRRAGEPIRLLDGRPAAEYARMTIPGARSVPNGELAHRLDALARWPGPTVIHCAGRTRSLVGAAGAILQGVPGPVLALENGTQGWALSGRVLDRGGRADALPFADIAASRARADRFAAEHGIRILDPRDADALLDDAGRTTFLFDVRDPDEARRRPVAGAAPAPGVQLVQATDAFIGTRHARVVLADDTGCRAALAAFWLRQLGYETFVLRDIAEWPEGWRARAPHAVPEPPPAVEAAAAVDGLTRGDLLLDLRPSGAFRAGHLPGAAWSIRPRLPRVAAGRIVHLVGDEEAVALAALDLGEAGAKPRHVGGDPAAWTAAGLNLVSTPGDPSDEEAIDFLRFVHDRHDGNLDAARRYLAWETGLLAQLDPAERSTFTLDAIDLRR